MNSLCRETSRIYELKQAVLPRLVCIRTIYLYLFSIIGLVLLVIGSVGLVDLALKTWVFTNAESESRMYAMQLPQPWSLEKASSLSEDSELSAEDREAISNWLNDYSAWEENNKNYDPLKSQRQAASNIAMILIGLPLYLFHWRIIKKEN